MKLLIFSLIAFNTLLSQTVITNVKVFKGHGTAQVTFTIDAAAAAARQTPASCWHSYTPTVDGTTRSRNVSDIASTGSPTRRHCAFAATPGSTVYFRPSNGDSNWSCVTPDDTTYTCEAGLGKIVFDPEPEIHPVPPTAPATVDTTMPTINGSNFDVSADCSNLQTQFNACAAADTSLNHTVTIPVAASCRQNIVLPTKVGAGTCVVQSAAAASLLENVRVNLDDAQFMPSLQVPYTRGNGNSLGLFTGTNTSEGWRFVGIRFRDENIATHVPIIRNITAVTDTGTITTDSPHGLAFPEFVTVTGVTGFRGRGPNATGRVASSTSTTFSITGVTEGCASPPCYAGGGRVWAGNGSSITNATNTNPITLTTAYWHGLVNEPWMPILTITGSTQSTVNIAAASGIQGVALQNVFAEVRNAPNPALNGKWSMYPTTATALSLRNSPVVACSSNCGEVRLRQVIGVAGVRGNTAANGTRFFTVVDDNTITLDDTAGNGVHTGGGAFAMENGPYGRLLNFTQNNDRIILDRCMMTAEHPTRLTYGLVLGSDNSAVINSYFSGMNYWIGYVPNMWYQSTAASTGYFAATSVAIEVTDGSPKLIHNNYLAATGITLFNQEGSLPGNTGSDLTVTQNHLHSPIETYRADNNPFSNGLYYPKRHHFEMKQGQRIRFEGNIVENNWSDWTPCGPAIAISPRGTNGNTGNNQSDIAIRNNWIRNTGNAIQISGIDSYSDRPGIGATARVAITNNLFTGLNRRMLAVSPVVGAAAGLCGYTLQTAWTVEDVLFEHNTVTGSRSTQGGWINYGTGRSEGIVIRYNLAFVNNDNSGGAVPKLYSGGLPLITGTPAAIFAAANDNSTISYNYLVPGVENSTNTDETRWTSTDTANTWTQAECESHMSGFTGITCQGGATALDRMQAAGLLCGVNCQLWDDGRIQLRAGEVKANAAVPVAPDGKLMGASTEDIYAATGLVSNVRVLAKNTTSATIGFYAPDTQGCPIRYGTTYAMATFTDVANAGGTREQAVAITGLTTGTRYYFQVMCETSRPRGSFHTY